MADPTISIQVLTDAAQTASEVAASSAALDDLAGSAKAASGKVDSAGDSMRDLGDQADAGAKKVRNVDDTLDNIGGTAGGVTSGLRDMADAVEMVGFPGLSSAMGIAAVGFEAIDGATTLYAATSGILSKALGGVTKAFNFLKVAILSNPIFWIAAVIIGIVAAFVLLYKNCEDFRKIVDAVFKFAWNLIKGFWEWIKGAFTALINILRKPFDIWLSVVKTVIGVIRTIITTLVDWIGAYIQFIWKFWKTVFDKVVAIVRKAIDWVADIIRSIVDTVSNVVDAVKNAFAKVFDAITAPFRNAMQWVKDHFKLPKIDLNPFKSAPTVAGVSITPRGAATQTAASQGGVVINITGPISTHDTVRELRRLFRDDQARLGRAALRPVVA